MQQVNVAERSRGPESDTIAFQPWLEGLYQVQAGGIPPLDGATFVELHMKLCFLGENEDIINRWRRRCCTSGQGDGSCWDILYLRDHCCFPLIKESSFLASLQQQNPTK